MGDIAWKEPRMQGPQTLQAVWTLTGHPSTRALFFLHVVNGTRPVMRMAVMTLAAI